MGADSTGAHYLFKGLSAGRAAGIRSFRGLFLTNISVTPLA
jgi:hypothetical protein